MWPVSPWHGLSVLITGGTGSFGSAVIPALLARGARRVIVYSRDEGKRAHLLRSWQGRPVEHHVGDIRDADRLRWSLRAGIDVVLHAAAMKHIDACEQNPTEAVRTNIEGTQHVVDAAILAGVPRVLALSSDKACAASTHYGATKYAMEGLVVRGNIRGGQTTRLACVRYGNVIGSSGSVVETFRRRVALGMPLPVTSLLMTRFWMPMPQAVEFVMSSADRCCGGEVFVPKLAASSLLELVAALAGPDYPIDIIGLRGSEKLHECLISVDEAIRAHDLGDCYAIYPDDPSWPLERQGVPVPEGFTLTSATAPRFAWTREVLAA